jgi:hypothetical protein
MTLNVGDIYPFPVEQTQPPASALPQNRTYRTVVIDDKTDIVKEVYMADTYWDAHMRALVFDSLYNYPDDFYWVERSIDGGLTWHPYEAEEFIDNRPAWVVLKEVE